MASCSHCGADIGELLGCPKCGKSVSGAAQGSKQVVFEAPDDGPSLELDVVLPGPMSGAGRDGVARVIPIGPAFDVDAPPPKVDPVEARVTGKFGLPPDHWWEMPSYALQVRKRLPELEQITASHRERSAKTEAALQSQLDALALRAAAAADGFSRNARAPYAKTIEKLRATEAELRALEGERAAETDALTQELQAADQRMAELEKELEAATAEQRKAGDPTPPTARKRVDDARTKLKLGVEARAIVAEKLDSLTYGFSPAAKKARTEFQKVTKAFALFVLDDTTNFAEFKAFRQAILRLQAAAAGPRKDLLLHEAALRTYDAEAVKMGKTVMIAAALGAAAALVMIVLALLK